MTQQSPDASNSDLVVGMVLMVLSAGGSALAVSFLAGASWWLSLIAGIVVTVGTFAMLNGITGLVLGLFALFGFVSTFGWAVTLVAIGVPAILLPFVSPDRPKRVMTVEPQPPPGRAHASVAKRPPGSVRTASDDVLLQYAREYLADGGLRDTGAVVSAVRVRIMKEELSIGPGQDLSSIAGRALASTRSPSSGAERDAPSSSASGSHRRRPQASKDFAPKPEPKRNARQHLHEFGSFEIERIIARILDDTSSATDTELIDRVLTELEITDRSPFALERLSDAIRRVRGIAPPSARERRAEERSRKLDELPTRGTGGRTMLYEFGSHEIERVVEQLLVIDPRLTAKDLHEAVMRVLDVEDRTALARQRVADAAKRVSASLARSPGPGGRRRGPGPKKQAAKKPAEQKKSMKKVAKKASVKKRSSPVKATPSSSPKAVQKAETSTIAAKKPTKVRQTRKGVTPRKVAAQEDASKTAAKRNTSRTAAVASETERSDPQQRPKAQVSNPTENSGAPGAKDIADLLGF